MQRVDSFYGYEREATNFVFCGVYSREEDDLSSSKGHRNTQSNLRERLTNISGEIMLKNAKNNRDKSNNNNNNNTLKTPRTTKQNKIKLKDSEKYG